MDYDGRTSSDHCGNEVQYGARDWKKFMGTAAFDFGGRSDWGLFGVFGKGYFLAFLAQLDRKSVV